MATILPPWREAFEAEASDFGGATWSHWKVVGPIFVLEDRVGAPSIRSFIAEGWESTDLNR